MRFYNPVEINQSAGIRKNLASVCKGKEILVICSSSFYKRNYQDSYLFELFNNPECIFEHNFSSNPGLEEISSLCRKYSYKNLSTILGIGGGSAMDVAKILSVGIPALKKGISISQLIKKKDFFIKVNKIDTILVPTTAGTGSEVTPFATVWDYSSGKKLSLNDEKMYAVKAYLDSDFLKNIPLEVALSTGLDALNQAFESIWNKNSNSITIPYAMKAINLGINSLCSLEMINSSKRIRDDLMCSSLLAGLAISQTKTSICHSISYPLTIKLNIPHGLACAFSMREVLEFNYNEINVHFRNLKDCDSKISLHEKLENIFIKNDFKNIFKKYVKSDAEIIELINEMYTPGRFENNIKECSKNDLIKIIKNSCEYIF